jgi:Fic family protein
MAADSGKFIQQPAGYKAFIPKDLPPSPGISIDSGISKLLSDADRSLALLDGLSYILPNPELFISIFVKKEAVLSSQIEGTQASLKDILEFEAGISKENIEDVALTVNYINALNYGIRRLKNFPMSLRLIRELHKELLKNVRGEDKTPGEFRKTQNWIGSPGSTIQTATFIPPPPSELINLMGRLEKYVYEEPVYPLLINCALIHAQFETIHPFLDGNGRIGRLLITVYLYWKGILNKPLLYLSIYFKKNRTEYYDRLNAIRLKNDWEGWTRFFLQGIVETSSEATETAKRIIEIHRKFYNLMIEKEIAAPSILRLFDVLFQKPMLSTKDIAQKLDVSRQTANTLAGKLLDIGVVKEITGQQRHRVFAFKEYLDVIAEGTKV